MNTPVLPFVISLIAPFLTGLGLVCYFDRNNSLSFELRCALSYGLGAGLLAQMMLVLNMMGIPLSSTVIVSPFFIVIGLFLLFLRFWKKGREIFPQCSNNGHPQEGTPHPLIMKICTTVLCAYIFLIVFYVFWISLNVPLSIFDAFATVVFKSKVLYFQDYINFIKGGPHVPYPLHIELNQVWILNHLQSWNDQAIRIIFPLVFLSYLVIHYTFLKEQTGKFTAVLGTALFVSSLFVVIHATLSIRDFTLLYYNCTALALLLLWDKKGADVFLIMAGLFSGFTAFVKMEGSYYLLFHILFIAVILLCRRGLLVKDKIFKFMQFFLISMSICLPFHIFKLFHNIPNFERNTIMFGTDTFVRIPEILIKFSDYILFNSAFNYIWLLLAVSVITAIFYKDLRRICMTNKGIVLILAILLLYVLFYFSIFVFSSNYLYIATSDTFMRLCLHIFPAAVWLLVLIPYYFIQSKQGEK